MSLIEFEIPDEARLALKLPPDMLSKELRMLAAVKLYELGRLSSGAAAGLAGVARVVFLSRLADYGVDTFQLTEDELKQEASLV